ncbi:MAG: hypothetical protein BYD32DRAFT_442087 [Podila humilis]|nr:MAG: hypothetical protein BYD32DRAFT_442087 [Podila humilis]
MLEVQSPYLVYSRVRVIVHGDDSVQASRVSVGDHWSSQRRPLSMPLILKPRPRPIHYIPPEGAKVVGWFGNPMVLLSSFSFLMLLLMPKIMANLDDNALDALRSSYHFSCLPSLPHLPNPHPSHFNHHAMSSGMYPSSSPYMVDGALDQHPSNFFRSPAIFSHIHFSSTAPSEPFLVNMDSLHGEMNGPGSSSSSSTATMPMSNNNGYTGQYYPYPYTSHHQQQAPPVPVQSKKQK